MIPISKDRFLFISDLQIPFEAEHALKFCKAVQREFFIHPDNIYCVGDETDAYWGSAYPKDPDAKHTANQELEDSRQTLRKWYAAFPKMKLATSNHGQRWLKKATAAEIPSQLLKSYREVLQAPDGWIWKDRWNIKSDHPMIMQHGCGYSGQNGHRFAALDNGVSTIIGHLHSHAGIVHLRSQTGRKIWGFNCGSLIDIEQYAFHYSRYLRNQAVLGVGVVIDGGLTPIFLPYERF